LNRPQIFSCLISGTVIEKLGLRKSMIVSATIFSFGLVGQGSILQSSISAINFSGNFSPSNFVQISAQNQQI
jgi:hypothetical protein